MKILRVIYNPYTVETSIIQDGRNVTNTGFGSYCAGKRLQEWIEPRGNGRWNGFFKELFDTFGNEEVSVEFVGTVQDYADLCYAKNKYGKEFTDIKLCHINAESAARISSDAIMKKLEEMYEELKNGPVDELKSLDIQNAFEVAQNSDFRIVVVAPMSSGKSTLINAILGTNLLPAVNQATTAVITEIRDNDSLDHYIITSAEDKSGNVIAGNEPATIQRISELNYMIDPDDSEGKTAFVRRICLEGPIPNLPSDTLHTVFVDTPGGNNAMNEEHTKLMDEAIGDENKSLILYVFNGTQLSTDDGNLILQKIANSIKRSANGKQSRDRFLFVANRMDDFDVEKEPFQEVIKTSILPMLKNNGIEEPRLFLTSAQTAKLIRMEQHHESMTRKERQDLNQLSCDFNESDYALTAFASISDERKARLMLESEQCADDDVNASSRTAEINSGVPAVEAAIEEYLEKYAIAIKIKNLYDSFSHHLEELVNRLGFEKELAENKTKFDEVVEELGQKSKLKSVHQAKVDYFRQEVEKIGFDKAKILEVKSQFYGPADRIADSAEEEMSADDAKKQLEDYGRKVERIGENTIEKLNNEYQNEVTSVCTAVLDEFNEYIYGLKSEGILSIGNFDMTHTTDFNRLCSFNTNELIQQFTETKDVVVETRDVKKSGFGNFLKRLFGGWFGWGWETQEIKEKQQFVKVKEMLQSQILEVKHALDDEVDGAINAATTQTTKLKEEMYNRIDKLDRMIQRYVDEINKMVSDRDSLDQKVKDSAEKWKWVSDFNTRLSAILNIDNE